MAGSFFDRLGGLFGRRAEPAPAEAPAEEAAPAVAVEAPPAEAPAEPAYAEPAPAAVEAAPAEAAAPAVAEAAPAEMAAAPVDVAAEAPAEPARSAEEELEERLWAETHEAWAQGDFQTVTARLDALKALQPEDAAEIDEKIAAAQYNHASQVEQSGDLQRALYLYEEAQRRNPNLGEAAFAIERVQAALAPPPAEAEAAPAERTYTVAEGDSLWAIAEQVYGSGSEWTRILEANRDQISDPDLLQAGQTLRIPDSA
jgi:LysM repeat protein